MKFIFPLLLFLSTSIFYGQDSIPVPENNKPKVFIDCQDCDLDFIKQEVPYLQYVRDRLVSDVHVMVVAENNGSGGERHTIYFYGQSEYSGNNDTLQISIDVNKTEDEIRRLQLKTIEIGLARYMVKKGFIADISFSCDIKETTEKTKDKWNNWVFNISSNGWFNGEEQYYSTNFNGYIDISRVTEKLKFESSLGFHYNESKYQFEDDWIKSYRKSQFGELSLVKSISDHWSWGGFGGFNSSLFDNLKIRTALFPAVEYNVFPYSESTKHQIRINYKLGGHFNQYFESTIYDKQEEVLGVQEISLEAKFQEKWGSISSSISFSHYLQDINLNSTNFWASMDLRIAKGLSINFSGWLALIHNQITLPKGDASQEDVLLRQRQLQTGFRYWGNVGFSYTFGSIYNSIVNPRFGT